MHVRLGGLTRFGRSRRWGASRPVVAREPADSVPLLRSLRFRLFLALFASILLVQGLAGWTIMNQLDVGFDAQMRAQALTMGKLTQALYDQRGQALLDNARLIAAMPEVQSAAMQGDRVELLRVGLPVANAIPGASISFFDADGKALVRSWAPDLFGDFSSGSLIGLRRAQQGQANYSVENSSMLGLALHGFAPISYDGGVVGVVSVSERFDQELMERTKEATGYAATILAPDGTPIAWTHDPVHAVTMLHPSLSKQALATIRSGHEFTAVTYIGGMPFGSYALPLRDPGGKLVGIVTVTTSMSEFGQARSSVRRAILLIGLLAFGMTIVVAWVLSRSLIRPLQQLTNAATRIADGSYDLPAQVHTDNEIGILARAFDHMRERVGHASRALIEEKANAENERNLMNAILNSTHDGIIMYDADDRFKVVNRRWEEFFGLAWANLAGLTALQVMEVTRDDFADPLAFEASTRLLLADPSRVAQRDEFEQLRPTRRILRCYAAPVHDATGQVIGRVFVYQDVTREHQSDELKSALISTVSHELRLPLTSIKGYARTLLLDDPPWREKERREFLEYIDEESDKLSDMVNNLLDVSKIEAGVLQVQRHEVSLPTLLRKVVERQQQLLANSSVSFDIPTALPVVEADAHRIEQVLYNLIENAVKYGRPEGKIVIGAAEVGGEVRVTVADDGPGIPSADAERVFERFYQVDQSLSRQTGGSGLGLSICRGIVEAHGGRIWVDGERAAAGCAITFTLPLAFSATEPRALTRHRAWEG